MLVWIVVCLNGVVASNLSAAGSDSTALVSLAKAFSAYFEEQQMVEERFNLNFGQSDSRAGSICPYSFLHPPSSILTILFLCTCHVMCGAQDRQIGKTIFSITGSVSASNYLQIPVRYLLDESKLFVHILT